MRTKVKEDTLITKDEIASLIRKFMHLGSDEVRDMRKRSRELKQLCHGAIASGGSSETNINLPLRGWSINLGKVRKGTPLKTPSLVEFQPQ